MSPRLREPFVLYKRILPSGKTCYYYYFWEDGRRVCKSTGLTNKAKAYHFAKHDLETRNSKVKVVPTLNERVAEWFISGKCPYIAAREDTGRPLAMATITNYRYSLVNHILPVIGDKRIDAVTVRDAEELLRRVHELGLSESTATHVRQALAVVYSELRRLGETENNPTAQLLRGRKSQVTRGALSQDECEKLFSSEWKHKQVRLATLLAYLTGMRLGEIQALRWDDVDLQGQNLIRVHRSYSDLEGFKSTKTSHERFLPIFPRLKSQVMFELRRSGSGLLFGQQDNPDKPLAKTTLNKYFQRQCMEIGIDVKSRRITFHSLRHTAVTLLKASGMTEAQVMQIVGHTTVAMSSHYTHNTQENGIRAAGALERAFQVQELSEVDSIMAQIRNSAKK